MAITTEFDDNQEAAIELILSTLLAARNKKVVQRDALADVQDSDILPIVRGLTSNRINWGVLKTALNASVVNASFASLTGAPTDNTPLVNYIAQEIANNPAVDVLATVLAGLVTTNNADVQATDTLIVGIGKLQSQLSDLVNTFLALAGGTMTGNLLLNGDPTLNLQAATKQYVDAQVISTPTPEDWPANNTIVLGQDRNYNQHTVSGTTVNVLLDRTGITNYRFFTVQFNILSGGSVAFSADFADVTDGASSAPTINENGLFMVYGLFDQASGRNKVLLQIPALRAGDITEPLIVTAVVQNATPNQIDVTYNEVVTLTNSGYSLTFTTGTAKTITGVSGSGNTRAFTLSANVDPADVFTLNYDSASGNTLDESGNELQDVNFSVTNNVGATVPGPPGTLNATANGSDRIDLVWSAPSSNGGSAIIGYRIERESPVGGGFTVLVANTGNVNTTYIDNNPALSQSTQYNYRISAINSVGTGSPGNEANATTSSTGPSQLDTPANVTLLPISDTEISVDWDNVSNATSYLIEYDTSNTFPSPQSTTVSESFANISGLSAETEYFVRIIAKAAGFTDSNPSVTQSATTLAAVFSLFSPGSGETGIGINTVIVISFSELAKLSSGELTDANVDAFIELEETISTNAVSFDATVNTADDRVTITPSSNLPGSTQITARLLAGLETTGGTAFPANSTTFTTGGSSDSTAPTFVNASVGPQVPNCILVNFDEDLNASIVPALTSMVPRINTVNATVKSLRIINNSVLCYIQENIQPGETIDIAYTQPGTDRLQDLTGNEIATFTAQTVSNDTVAFDRGASAFVWLLTEHEFSDWDREGINRADFFRDRKGNVNFIASASTEPIIDTSLVSGRLVMRGYDTVTTANNAYQILEEGSAPYTDFNYLHDGSDFTIFTIHHIPEFTAGDRYVFVTRSGGTAGGGLLLYVRSATQIALFVANESATRPVNVTQNLAGTLTAGPHVFHCRYNSTNEEYTWGIDDESFVTAKNPSGAFSTLEHLQGEVLDAATKAMSFGELLTFKSFLTGTAYTDEFNAIKSYWGI